MFDLKASKTRIFNSIKNYYIIVEVADKLTGFTKVLMITTFLKWLLSRCPKELDMPVDIQHAKKVEEVLQQQLKGTKEGPDEQQEEDSVLVSKGQ